MKKQILSPIFTLIAMLLIIISRVLIDDVVNNVIFYLAIIVAIASLFVIIQACRASK